MYSGVVKKRVIKTKQHHRKKQNNNNKNQYGQYSATYSWYTKRQKSLIIHKEKAKKINVRWVSLYLIKTRLNFTSIFLD